MFPALRKTATVFVIFTALMFAVTSRNTSAGEKGRPAFAGPTAAQDVPPAWCKVTVPADGSFTPPPSMPSDPDSAWEAPIGRNLFWFGSEKLWTMLPKDGTWRAWRANWSPDIPGEFAYDNKFPWFHQSESADDGPLTVTGKRLDDPAPSFTERDWMSSFGRTPDGVEGIMGGIGIPTYGCWQVTGHFLEQELTFTVWVAPRPGQEGTNQVRQVVSEAKPLPIVKVDGADDAKLLDYSVTPEVPPTARGASGTVVLHAIIDRDGRPEQLQYVSGPP